MANKNRGRLESIRRGYLGDLNKVLLQRHGPVLSDVDSYMNIDPRRIWLKGQELGIRLNLTYDERLRVGAFRINPVDKTPDQLAELRKARDRARKEAKRRQAGAKSRQAYEAESLSKQKPWEAEGTAGIASVRQVRPEKLITATEQLVSTSEGPPAQGSSTLNLRTQSWQLSTTGKADLALLCCHLWNNLSHLAAA
jgi:hypothetical protein